MSLCGLVAQLCVVSDILFRMHVRGYDVDASFAILKYRHDSADNRFHNFVYFVTKSVTLGFIRPLKCL